MARTTPHAALFLCVTSVGAMLFAACTTDYQQGLEDPNFGDPNALANEKQPSSSTENTSDGGASAGSGVPECVKSGGTLIDAGSCAISFKTNILEAFRAATCQTTSSCHGGENPPNQPRINPDDGPGMWALFASFKLSNGKMYINPCSTDPAASGIACNVDNNAPCGVVMPPGGSFPSSSVEDIKTWLKCGAPNN